MQRFKMATYCEVWMDYILTVWDIEDVKCQLGKEDGELEDAVGRK